MGKMSFDTRRISNRILSGAAIAVLGLIAIGPRASAQTYVFGTASYPAPGSGPMITADFNGDGIPDIAGLCAAAVPGTAAVCVLLGKPDGTFAASVETPINLLGANNPPMVTGDFNGDGKLDLITFGWFGSSGSLALLAGNGDGTFQPAVQCLCAKEGTGEAGLPAQ
jgi:hypothetical protein